MSRPDAFRGFDMDRNKTGMLTMPVFPYIIYVLNEAYIVFTGGYLLWQKRWRKR